MIRVGVIAAALLGVSMVSCAGDSATQTTSESVNDSSEAAAPGSVADKLPADVIIADSAFMGLPATLGEELAELPEVAVVSPVRPSSMVVDNEEVFVAGVDPTTFGSLADLGFTDGSIGDLAAGGVALQRSTAEAMGVEVGGSIDVTWPSGDSAAVEVVGVFTEGTFGNWVTSLDQIPFETTTDARDMFVLVLLDSSSTEAEGRSAVASVLESYPTAQAQWRSDFEAGLVPD